MKKVGSVILGLFVVMLLTGCLGSKTLSCETTSDSDGLKATQQYEFKYSGEKMSTAKITLKMEVEDVDNYDTYESILDSSFKEQLGLEDVDGIEVKTASKKPVYTITIDMDFKKLKDNSKLDELGLSITEDDLELSIDELQKQIEDSGLTCKVK